MTDLMALRFTNGRGGAYPRGVRLSSPSSGVNGAQPVWVLVVGGPPPGAAGRHSRRRFHDRCVLCERRGVSACTTTWPMR